MAKIITKKCIVCNDGEVEDNGPKACPTCGGNGYIDWIPKIICVCGSLRFIETFKEAELQCVLDGNIALLPCLMFSDIQREYGVESDLKMKVDELHKRKIDLCDEVFVLNVGGYIGESTRSEIEYAQQDGKIITYLEPVDAPVTIDTPEIPY